MYTSMCFAHGGAHHGVYPVMYTYCEKDEKKPPTFFVCNEFFILLRMRRHVMWTSSNTSTEASQGTPAKSTAKSTARSAVKSTAWSTTRSTARSPTRSSRSTLERAKSAARVSFLSSVALLQAASLVHTIVAHKVQYAEVKEHCVTNFDARRGAVAVGRMVVQHLLPVSNLSHMGTTLEKLKTTSIL